MVSTAQQQTTSALYEHQENSTTSRQTDADILKKTLAHPAKQGQAKT
jgi:hypothetical protein